MTGKKWTEALDSVMPTGECKTCHEQEELNGDGQCVGCWSDTPVPEPPQEHDLDGTPLPAGWPTYAEQKAYWDRLPQYECPVCGEWHGVSAAMCDLHCHGCGSHLMVSRDGEVRDGMWRDLTNLVVR